MGTRKFDYLSWNAVRNCSVQKQSNTGTLPEPHASVISSNPISLRSTSILASILSLPLQHDLFKSCFATKVLYMPCPACRPWLDRPHNTGLKRNKNSFSCRLRIPHGCNEARAEQLPVKCSAMQQTRVSTFLLPSILRLMTWVIQAYPPHSSSGVSPYKMIDEVIIILLIKLLFPCKHGWNPSFLTVGRKVTYISWNKKVTQLLVFIISSLNTSRLPFSCKGTMQLTLMQL